MTAVIERAERLEPKPPYGRVPEVEMFNLDHYCHEGPLAGTVADGALMENVIAGMSADGLPIGMSIMARTFDDITAFRIAAAHEELLGWWTDGGRRPAL